LEGPASNDKGIERGGWQDVGTDNYRDYHRSHRTGLFEPGHVDERLHAKDLVIGLTTKDHHKAYPLDKKHWETNAKDQLQLVQDTLSDIPIFVFHDPEMYATSVFDRRLSDESVVTFNALTNGYFATDTDGQAWNLLTGTGPEGQVLKPIPHMNVYWFAWSDFYPDTDLWSK